MKGKKKSSIPHCWALRLFSTFFDTVRHLLSAHLAPGACALPTWSRSFLAATIRYQDSVVQALKEVRGGTSPVAQRPEPQRIGTSECRQPPAVNSCLAHAHVARTSKRHQRGRLRSLPAKNRSAMGFHFPALGRTNLAPS